MDAGSTALPEGPERASAPALVGHAARLDSGNLAESFLKTASVCRRMVIFTIFLFSLCRIGRNRQCRTRGIFHFIIA